MRSPIEKIKNEIDELDRKLKYARYQSVEEKQLRSLRTQALLVLSWIENEAKANHRENGQLSETTVANYHPPGHDHNLGECPLCGTIEELDWDEALEALPAQLTSRKLRVLEAAIEKLKAGAANHE